MNVKSQKLTQKAPVNRADNYRYHQRSYMKQPVNLQEKVFSWKIENEKHSKILLKKLTIKRLHVMNGGQNSSKSKSQCDQNNTLLSQRSKPLDSISHHSSHHQPRNHTQKNKCQPPSVQDKCKARRSVLPLEYQNKLLSKVSHSKYENLTYLRCTEIFRGIVVEQKVGALQFHFVPHGSLASVNR